MRAGLIALLLLAGCARTEGEILSRDWVKPDPKVTAMAAARAPLYCYSTRGSVDCQATPIVEENNRLKGYYGPSPLAQMEQPVPLLVPAGMSTSGAPIPAPMPVAVVPVAVLPPPPVVQTVTQTTVTQTKTARTSAPTSLRRKGKKVSGSP